MLTYYLYECQGVICIRAPGSIITGPSMDSPGRTGSAPHDVLHRVDHVHVLQKLPLRVGD